MSSLLAPLPGSPTGQVIGSSRNGYYVGYNLREVSGSASAVLRLRSGVGNGGTIIGEIVVPQSGFVDHEFPVEDYENFTGGLFVELVSGTMPEGFVRWQP